MKKIALVLAVLLALGCSGCGSKGVPQEEYDALKAQLESLRNEQKENDGLKEQLESLQNELAEARQALEDASRSAESAAEPSETPSEPAETEPESTEAEMTEAETTEAETEAPTEEAEIFDVSETEIRGGTNQADAMQLPLNTKVYGTLHDALNMYLSFHTGPDAGSTYKITVINKTPIYGRIGFYVLDEYGTKLSSARAYHEGIATTFSAEGLLPDTDYYIRLIAQNHGNDGARNDTVRFAVTIRDINAQADGISTTNDLVNAVVPPDDITGLNIGTNQDDSALIPFDQTVNDELKDALGGWFAFATDDSAESSYFISVVNKSTEYLRIGIYVFDEFGTEIAREKAYNDGVMTTFTLEGLDPNSVYYIRLIAENHGNDGTRTETVGYALTIRRQKNTTEADPAAVEDAGDVVFETPFELSSTQVRFVANQAVFVDENEAKEALAPVAEIILAHPDHPILLAGTTARWGSQESCVELSNKRADAVKELLVNGFGVPASQLITVGLGYEDDPFVRGRDIDANGRFVETEGAKNRRVIVLDAESDIARQILGN